VDRLLLRVDLPFRHRYAERDENHSGYPEPLLHSAKDLAAARSVTLSAVVEDALRGSLSAKSGEAAKPFRLPTARGRLVEPGTDLDRTSALLLTDDESKFGAHR
jgi:hypothetical protein